jgi:hypothetical protein
MSAVCIVLAVLLYIVIRYTRLGMMIRAGASNREMVQSLGLNINLVYRLVFALGVALAAFAGMIAAPVSSVYPGMGTGVLIICFVVVVIGGIGSIRGALVASLLIGLADTFGKVLVRSSPASRSRADGGDPPLAAWKASSAGSDGRCRYRRWASSRCVPDGPALGHRRAACGVAPSQLSGATFYVELATKVMILAIFALSLDSRRLYGARLRSASRVLRHWRVHARLRAEVRSGKPLAHAAARDARRGVCALVVGVRRARQGHLLHHGDARLRADVLFRLPRHRVRPRLGRDQHELQAGRDDRRLHALRPRQRDAALLLRALRDDRRLRVPADVAALHFRPGAAGDSQQRAPDALARLPGLLVQAASFALAARWRWRATCRRCSSVSSTRNCFRGTNPATCCSC